MAVALPLTSSAKAAEYRAAGLWSDRTLAERFLGHAARLPDKTALVVGEKRATYAQLRDDVLRTARGLLERGLQPGDIVAGQLPNAAEMPVLHLACNVAGLLYMPLHDSWRALEVRHLLAQARVRVLVSHHVYRGFDHAAMVAGFRAELPDLNTHFTLGGAPAGAGVEPYENLAHAEPLDHAAILAHRPDPDLPAAIMLSSGTTAISKISRFSSNDLQAMLDMVRDRAGVGESDIAGGLAPAGTGATGYVFPVLLPLLNGATSVLLPLWGDPEEAADMLVRERCTTATAIPTQLVKMVPALRGRSRDDFAHLRVVTNAGAPLPYETAVEVEELTGAVIQSIYGATDAGTPTATAWDDPREKRLRTVGRVAPGAECEIRGPDGKSLPAGCEGEVTWRTPDKSWGYLGDDRQTAAVFDADHFYRSGDLGQLDEQGYLRIVGRIKDMILRGGRNISPLVIEEALRRHPQVHDVAVAGIPDPVLGERACAFVIQREGPALQLAEIVAFLRGEDLATWQLPERLELLDEFPQSAGGKIQKGALTELVARKLRAGE